MNVFKNNNNRKRTKGRLQQVIQMGDKTRTIHHLTPNALFRKKVMAFRRYGIKA